MSALPTPPELWATIREIESLPHQVNGAPRLKSNRQLIIEAAGRHDLTEDDLIVRGIIGPRRQRGHDNP
jgi:hypothetical protein